MESAQKPGLESDTLRQAMVEKNRDFAKYSKYL